MRKALCRSLIAAFVIGPVVGLLSEALLVRGAVIYVPPVSNSEMDSMENLPMKHFEAALAARKRHLTRWEWLKDSVPYAYFWKDIARRSIVPTSGVFLACVCVGWMEARKPQAAHLPATSSSS